MAVEESAPAGDGEVGTPLATDVEVDAVDSEASQEVMRLLSQHVPLALLADLAIPSGPESPQILQDEGLPDVAWWDAHDDGAGDTTAGEDGATKDAQVAP